jgi:hypothetical protein
MVKTATHKDGIAQLDNTVYQVVSDISLQKQITRDPKFPFAKNKNIQKNNKNISKLTSFPQESMTDSLPETVSVKMHQRAAVTQLFRETRGHFREMRTSQRNGPFPICGTFFIGKSINFKQEYVGAPSSFCRCRL